MTTSKKRAFTHTGNLLIAGFIGMLIMMSVLIYLCVKQDFSLVSKDYYEQELVYQQKIDATKNAGDLAISLDKADGTILLHIPDELSSQITNGKVHFYCPANDKLDRVKTISSSADGVYRFEAKDLSNTAYIVKLSFDAKGKSYYKELPL